MKTATAVWLNQEISRYLQSYCSDEQQRWCEFLPWAEYAQNSLTHSSTGLTPFQCILGYQPPLFPWSDEPSDVTAVDDWAHCSQEVWKSAHVHLQQAIRRQKIQADCHSGTTPQVPGGPAGLALYTKFEAKATMPQAQPTLHGPSCDVSPSPPTGIWNSPASNTTASARISACLADISSWMTAHQLKLNPSKTELLIIPSDPFPAQDLAISLSNSMISPSATVRNLGVTMDNQLSFSSHVTNVTRSCRFLLYNIRRIRPFLSTQATQVLVQSLVISRLDYCNSLLAGLPLNAIRPLQMIQNAAARLVFNLPKFSHTTPLLRSLHWLLVAARIRFKTLMLAYKAKNGPAPSYLKALVTRRTAPRSLRSTSTARLVSPSLREKGRYTSRLFSVLAPRWWNKLPPGIRTAESLTVFKRQLKTYLFLKYLN
ncbi:hypothetical protein QTP86_012466 [Hemibagrus guttatus]|nr:hypothetical protein QTP86_012466 [Hemibagrus guttatus]